jgi:hypothetical protein
VSCVYGRFWVITERGNGFKVVQNVFKSYQHLAAYDIILDQDGVYVGIGLVRLGVGWCSNVERPRYGR